MWYCIQTFRRFYAEEKQTIQWNRGPHITVLNYPFSSGRYVLITSSCPAHLRLQSSFAKKLKAYISLHTFTIIPRCSDGGEDFFAWSPQSKGRFLPWCRYPCRCIIRSGFNWSARQYLYFFQNALIYLNFSTTLNRILGILRRSEKEKQASGSWRHFQNICFPPWIAAKSRWISQLVCKRKKKSVSKTLVREKDKERRCHSGSAIRCLRMSTSLDLRLYPCRGSAGVLRFCIWQVHFWLCEASSFLEARRSKSERFQGIDSILATENSFFFQS